MSWLVAGLIGGVVAWIAGLRAVEQSVHEGDGASRAGSPSPEEMKAFMGPAMAKSAVLAFAFGNPLRVSVPPIPLRPLGVGRRPSPAWSSATVLWLPTIALQTLGSGVWYVKAQGLLRATFWAWFIRMNVVGLVVGLLLK